MLKTLWKLCGKVLMKEVSVGEFFDTNFLLGQTNPIQL